MGKVDFQKFMKLRKLYRKEKLILATALTFYGMTIFIMACHLHSLPRLPQSVFFGSCAVLLGLGMFIAGITWFYKNA